jgi:hypothetical protein
MRDRLWEVPAFMPPGNYVYRSFFRFCNPMRCRDFHMPEMPIYIQ